MEGPSKSRSSSCQGPLTVCYGIIIYVELLKMIRSTDHQRHRKDQRYHPYAEREPDSEPVQRTRKYTKEYDFVYSGTVVFVILRRLVHHFYDIVQVHETKKTYTYLEDSLSIDDVLFSAECAINIVRHMTMVWDVQPQTQHDDVVLAGAAVFTAWGNYSDLSITEREFSLKILSNVTKIEISKMWVELLPLLGQYCSSTPKKWENHEGNHYETMKDAFLELASNISDFARNEAIEILKLLPEDHGYRNASNEYRNASNNSNNSINHDKFKNRGNFENLVDSDDMDDIGDVNDDDIMGRELHSPPLSML